MVIRVPSVSDQMPLHEFHDVFRPILGWNGDLGYIVRVHGQEINSFRRKTQSKAARVQAALGGGEPKNSLSKQDSMALQNWVIQRLTKQMRSEKNPSIATRRDTALIAAVCVAPAKGTPRKWPENCLKVEGSEVLLWDAAIEEPCFAVSLRFWHAWRERLATAALPQISPMEPITTPFPRTRRCSLEPSSPAQRSPATQPGRESAIALGPSLRKRSEPLSSGGILFK
jgi:hypothetical protein